MSEEMRRKQLIAIERAKEYREQHGEPVENLAVLLSSLADPETWQAVLDDPDVYGSE